jgi:hypothetical protein
LRSSVDLCVDRRHAATVPQIFWARRGIPQSSAASCRRW